MTCEEKARLVATYEADAQKFATAVTELRQKLGTTAYERLQRASDEARVNCEKARLALEQHIAAHGC